ncbi:MAG: ABC transporter ATP-binding protein [Chloroflexia bacterium]|nr:ABC transporter ATP-binding protein [Chloroflexia bacterium]
MIRLARYLKPFWLHLLLAVILLFVQANADLALPDYMSHIVNVGIQQGGVENAVPLAIRADRMELLTVFMDAQEASEVLAHYNLVTADSTHYARYLEEYPALSEQPVYVRKEMEPAEIERLNPLLSRPLVIVSGLEQMLSDPARAAMIASLLGLDPSELAAGQDILQLLAKLPEEQLAQIRSMVEQRLGAMDESLLVQAAALPIQAEYEALGMDTAGLQTRYILRTGLLMLLLTLLSAACTIAVGFLAARTAAGLARNLRRLAFRQVESFSNAEFDQFSTASLITRSTNDITQIQMVVMMMVRLVFYAPIIGVGAVIHAVGKSASMWWIIALAVGVLLGLVLIVFSIALPRFRSIQGLIDRLNLVMRENLSGMMVIRAFNRQDFEEERFDRANLDLTRTMLFVSRLMVVMMPLMMMLLNGLSLLIIWVGAHQVAEANMQVGDMMAFLQYAMQIVFAFLMMSMMFIILPRASVSAGRIADVLETEPSIRDPDQPRQFPEQGRGRIEFRQVCFRYPGAEEDVLHDINFVAQPGQTTAFIGSTGSGKSTVVNLIPRFYDVTSGAILVDGVDVRQVTQHDLRDRIGYIPQRGILFSGTVESNLRYADENADTEDLEQAVEIAQVDDFIESSPEGWGTEISQGGSNVSGGQKQRLSIARALVKKPPIYIFDDSFSALDFRTEADLRRALKEKLAESTVLVVTQRVSTIMHAEQIVVLDKGRIVGQGTHRELVRDCQVYREIAISQLGEEAAA